MSNGEFSLDHLEHDVLARIARHRQLARAPRIALPVAVGIAACALAAGVSVGAFYAQHDVPSLMGSESVVLADDARLAPSTLLMSTP